MNEPMFLSIEGELQLDALEHAANQLICRHEVLQCAFQVVDGRIVMEVQPDAVVKLNILKVLQTCRVLALPLKGDSPSCVAFQQTDSVGMPLAAEWQGDND